MVQYMLSLAAGVVLYPYNTSGSRSGNLGLIFLNVCFNTYPTFLFYGHFSARNESKNTCTIIHSCPLHCTPLILSLWLEHGSQAQTHWSKPSLKKVEHAAFNGHDQSSLLLAFTMLSYYSGAIFANCFFFQPLKKINDVNLRNHIRFDWLGVLTFNFNRKYIILFGQHIF